IRSGRAIAVLAAVAVLGIGSAACGKRVSRIDPSAVTDLSGRWNDTDSRLVANELITQSLSGPWVSRYTSVNGGEPPAVIVGSFRNRTLEHIPVNTFIADLERAMINSGAVTMVASPTQRSEIRDERTDQQENARADTRARMAQELGADYMFQGEITAIEDEEGREKVVYYQIDATLTDLESNVRVWAGQHRIKKYIERARIGW
ncbi:MAG TPA: penicillin-binding protein activator LpoB, partial [Longimicrobiales bacterium]|nr:penicillin-binding protein activator LpoB [Longimicrobiales bacterium]